MPVRIAGIILPDRKRISIALPYVYGLGTSASLHVLTKAGVDPMKRCADLTEQETARIREMIENEYRTEGELRREVLQNIRRMKEIGSHRGTRHARHLPVRGQRTKTNSRTVRGNVRRTAGSGKRKSAEKT